MGRFGFLGFGFSSVWGVLFFSSVWLLVFGFQRLEFLESVAVLALLFPGLGVLLLVFWALLRLGFIQAGCISLRSRVLLRLLGPGVVVPLGFRVLLVRFVVFVPCI